MYSHGFTEIKGENGVRAFLRKREEVKLLHQQIESLRASVELQKDRVKAWSITWGMIGLGVGMVAGMILYPVVSR